MKIALLLLSFVSFADEYQNTDNQGLGKYDRININEDRVINMNKKITSLENEVQSLKQQISELEKKIKEIKVTPIENP